VVVLVDPHTASAGEYFPQFLQYHGRALVVGEHSSEGAGGFVERVAMPGNMTFFFTKGRTYFAETDELNVEAKGVTLDVRVPITEDNERAKLDGRDPVLETAMDALAEASVKIASSRLAGTRWRLQQVVAALGATAQIEAPEGYTIAFADDESLSITTDCNLGRAEYEVGAGGALKITPTISTLAACPDTSLGDEFVSWLAASKTFQIGDDGLAILTDEDSGVIALLFAAGPKTQ
jgi:heat shock protein HslJ